MSNIIPEVDKVTVANVVAGVVTVVYVGFMVVHPEITVPAGLAYIANICIGYLFTAAGYSGAKKVYLSAKAEPKVEEKKPETG